MVWCCAEQVYPGRRFDQYAILGNDNIITDAQVATVYEKLLADSGIPISYQKSLISDNGSLEFAKRFYTRGVSKDFSPVSLTCLMNYYHPYGLMAIHMTYPVKRFTTLARIGGFGYRTISHLPHRKPAKLGKLLSMFLKRSMPLELWLGRGRPLNPYLRGALIEFLRERTKPLDIKFYPDYNLEGLEDLYEWTVLRAWVQQWLAYARWYWLTAWSPDVTIQDFFEAPVPVLEGQNN